MGLPSAAAAGGLRGVASDDEVALHVERRDSGDAASAMLLAEEEPGPPARRTRCGEAGSASIPVVPNAAARGGSGGAPAAESSWGAAAAAARGESVSRLERRCEPAGDTSLADIPAAEAEAPALLRGRLREAAAAG
jgi:hypothetical protein